MTKFLAVSVLSFFVLGLALPVFAQVEPSQGCNLRTDIAAGELSPGYPAGNLTKGTSTKDAVLCSYALIKWISNWVFVFFIILTVVFVVWAAFDYLTAGGDANKISGAKQRVTFAVIAIIVALLAKILPQIVQITLGL